MSGRESELLHVCHLIHGLGVGGAEQVLVELARCARQAGLRLSVVNMVDHPNLLHAHALRDLGVDVRSLSLRTRWDPRAFRRAAVHVDSLRPDIVHTHMKHADLVGAAIARRRNIPMVSTLHVIEDAPTLVGRVKRRLAAQARTQVAARVIAVSDAQRRWYLESYPGAADRVVTIPNGASTPHPPVGAMRAALRASLGVPAGAILALSVSVMRPEKGLADLLTAATLLPDDLPLSIVLVGDGEERARLEAAAADPRVSSRVRFAGWRPDATALIHVADLVVHPSHADALPTALVLALAAGVPIVATRTGGIPEIVSADVGLLVPPRNPAQLAAALSELASATDVRQRMGAAARRRFADRFDARSWACRLASLYREVLDERTHR